MPTLEDKMHVLSLYYQRLRAMYPLQRPVYYSLTSSLVKYFLKTFQKTCFHLKPLAWGSTMNSLKRDWSQNSTKSINDPIKIEDQRHWQWQDKRVGTKLLPLCKMFSYSKQEEHWDMKVIVGDYKLTVLPKSLFASDSSLFDGSKSKSDAVRVT